MSTLSLDNATSLRVKLKSGTKKLKTKKKHKQKTLAKKTHKTRDADHLGFVCSVRS